MHYLAPMALRTVNDMVPGESAVISYISDHALSAKLMEMGFLPGTAIRFQFASLWKDPICISIQNFDVALRKEEAACIFVLGE